nr:ATP-binding cassette domain-containing protein [Salinicoccus albus]
MNQRALKLPDISGSFGNKDILEIESLTAYANDKIVIIGENGAGKSTLLKIIAGHFDVIWVRFRQRHLAKIEELGKGRVSGLRNRRGREKGESRA